MEKASLLSRLKNKYLLIALAFLIPTLTFAGTSQTKNDEVNGVQVTETVAPTITPTETPTPTIQPTPTNTPVPTLTPTNTAYTSRAYSAPTSMYIPPTQEPPAAQSNIQLDNNNYYINSAGNTVHSPADTLDGSVPAGASARCADGTYSFSASRRGTCSHHGGVETWL